MLQSIKLSVTGCCFHANGFVWLFVLLPPAPHGNTERAAVSPVDLESDDGEPRRAAEINLRNDNRPLATALYGLYGMGQKKSPGPGKVA